LADTIEKGFVEDIIRNFQFPISNSQFKATIVQNRIYEALKASDAAIVASGTATLEAAIMEVPMVITYKLSLLTAIIGRLFVRIERIGLPNIVAGKEIVPELVQGDATPAAIAQAVLRFLKDKDARNNVISELKEVRKKLGSGDASKRAAEAICKIIRN
jgi:lipid-A-disaccharide synthase